MRIVQKVLILTQKEKPELNIFVVDNTLSLFIKLEKLIQISALISLQVEPLKI